MLLSFFPYPVGHPEHEHCSLPSGSVCTPVLTVAPKFLGGERNSRRRHKNVENYFRDIFSMDYRVRRGVGDLNLNFTLWGGRGQPIQGLPLHCQSSWHAYIQPRNMETGG